MPHLLQILSYNPSSFPELQLSLCFFPNYFCLSVVPHPLEESQPCSERGDKFCKVVCLKRCIFTIHLWYYDPKILKLRRWLEKLWKAVRKTSKGCPTSPGTRGAHREEVRSGQPLLHPTTSQMDPLMSQHNLSNWQHETHVSEVPKTTFLGGMSSWKVPKTEAAVNG